MKLAWILKQVLELLWKQLVIASLNVSKFSVLLITEAEKGVGGGPGPGWLHWPPTVTQCSTRGRHWLLSARLTKSITTQQLLSRH